MRQQHYPHFVGLRLSDTELNVVKRLNAGHQTQSEVIRTIIRTEGQRQGIILKDQAQRKDDK